MPSSSSSSNKDAYGERLLVSLIDEYALNEPNRPWAAIPRSDDNLADGFVNISFGQFAKAINRAAVWLDQVLGASDGSFETFAYAGEKDIRYPIMGVAAVKTGRKSFEKQADLIVKASQDMPVVVAPELAELLAEGPSPPYAYTKSWEEAKDDPWIIFHTSGTTGTPTLHPRTLKLTRDFGAASGLPKPMTFTNMMMTFFDAAQTMPDRNAGIVSDQYSNSRWYVPLPSLHLLGMAAVLQMTAFLGSTIVFGPKNRPTTTDVVSQILTHTRLDGMLIPPSVLEDLCQNAEALTKVKGLKYIHFAGAPLNKEVGNLIAKDVHLLSAIGSTEAGPWFTSIRNDGVWNYDSFIKGTGIEFEPRDGNLYELVFRRREEYQRWQLIFMVYPHLDVFRTNDLFMKHPTEDGLWEYVGRADDIVTLSQGIDIYAPKLEKIIESHPRVRFAWAGGEGRHHPFLIIEVTGDIPESSANTCGTTPGKQDWIDEIWPVVEEANKSCVENVRFSKGLTVVASVDKPLPRTLKGTVARRKAALLYKEEIDNLYAK
ncbi:MAG: hypothetical protein Q9210_006319 [Variospora velana]